MKTADCNNSDLPWWFELYHISCLVIFVAIWYFLGVSVLIAILGAVAVIAAWKG